MNQIKKEQEERNKKEAKAQKESQKKIEKATTFVKKFDTEDALKALASVVRLNRAIEVSAAYSRAKEYGGKTSIYEFINLKDLNKTGILRDVESFTESKLETTKKLAEIKRIFYFIRNLETNEAIAVANAIA